MPSTNKLIFKPARNTRVSYLKLNTPFRATSTKKIDLFYSGPTFYNRLPES